MKPARSRCGKSFFVLREELDEYPSSDVYEKMMALQARAEHAGAQLQTATREMQSALMQAQSAHVAELEAGNRALAAALDRADIAEAWSAMQASVVGGPKKLRSWRCQCRLKFPQASELIDSI